VTGVCRCRKKKAGPEGPAKLIREAKSPGKDENPRGPPQHDRPESIVLHCNN